MLIQREKNLTQETFKQFSEQIRKIIVNYPTIIIDKLIESMEKQIRMVIKAKGNGIKYWKFPQFIYTSGDKFDNILSACFHIKISDI